MKKIPRHLVTFEFGADREALLLAKLGMGNRYIRLKTGLSSGKITYRLHKAKQLEENDHGYRVDWRNGNSPLLDRMLQDYAGILEREIDRRVVVKIVHPTPKTVKLKEV